MAPDAQKNSDRLDISAARLPELHADLVGFMRSDRGRDYFSQATDQDQLAVSPDGTRHEIFRGDSDAMWSWEVRGLERAKLYYIPKHMTELACTAAGSVPDFALQECDVPSPTGFMFFAQPFGTTYDGHEPTASFRACSWEVTRGAVWLGLYSDWYGYLDEALKNPQTLCMPDDAYEQARRIDHPLHFETYAFCPLVPAGLSAASPFVDQQRAVRHIENIIRTVWLLMRQPLTETHDEEADRASRKRMKRRGFTARPVRVIRLRQRERAAGTDREDRVREYHRQWIVRGHWRQQWYPGDQVHRPAWIAPYVKGPDGAPLMGGKKVFVLNGEKENGS